MNRSHSLPTLAAHVVGGALATPLMSQTFTHITTGNLIATDPGVNVQTYVGGSWIDFNNGRRMDLFVNSVAFCRNDGGDAPAAAASFGLDKNSPNPFNPATTISFTLPAEKTHIKLAVYDLLGREVAVLLDGPASAGRHVVSWDAGDAPAGVYYCRLESGTRTQVGKMLLIK